MSDTKRDAEMLENGLSTIMRGLNRCTAGDALSYLPLAQFRLVRAIGRGVETPSSLADHLATSVSAVTQLSNRLVASGWIEREEDVNDRRVRRLKLSAKGSRHVKRRNTLRIAEAERMLESLCDEERQTVLRGIELLTAACARPPAEGGSDSLVMIAELEQTRSAEGEITR